MLGGTGRSRGDEHESSLEDIVDWTVKGTEFEKCEHLTAVFQSGQTGGREILAEWGSSQRPSTKPCGQRGPRLLPHSALLSNFNGMSERFSQSHD